MDEISRVYWAKGMDGNASRILIKKPEGKRPLTN
jgi:hypothetical protein